MRDLLDRIGGWIVPPKAVAEPVRCPADEIEAWFRHVGVTVAVPELVGMTWVGDKHVTFTESELGTMTDEERDDLLIIRPDQATLSDLAWSAVHTAHEHERSYPGPLSWRRSEIVRKAVSLGARLGIVNGYSIGHDPKDPIPSTTLEFVRFRGNRCYWLGKPRWWWECHRRQGWTLNRHTPAYPFAFGTCARCVPCPECREPYDCAEGCSVNG